jgi:segregation and condensation protein A
MEYQVELESFRGPLDLLLYLVKHNEVDILDIPIAKIAQQFLEYLGILQLIDVDAAGEFLVMAATLTEIKSRMVLPRSELEEEEEDDPRLELVRQLVEYKKFKDAAAVLEAHAEAQSTRLPRISVDVPAAPGPDRQPLQHVELWDLVCAFGRLMRETQALQPRQIVMDETPQQVYMEQILQRLTASGSCSFHEVFDGPLTRGRLLGLFLAILELIRRHQIMAEQSEAFGDIRLSLLVVGQEAS